MSKIKNIFITTIVGLLLLTSLCFCHKFPEDPFISFRSPHDRLTLYEWTITSYQINGTEHIHDFDSILSPRTLKDLTLQFSDYEYKNTVYRLYYMDGFKELVTDGEVGFSSVNTIHVSNIDTLFVEKFWNMPKVKPNTQWTSADWGIRELYKKNCHLRRNNIDIYLKGK